MSNPYRPPGGAGAGGLYDDHGYHSLSDIPWVLFSIDGRIPRRTYWGWYLATNVIMICTYAASSVLIETFQMGAAPELVMLLLVVPWTWIYVALHVKRWHDRGKSGWWMLIRGIPLIGPIWSFAEVGCMRGDIGANDYGADLT